MLRNTLLTLVALPVRYEIFETRTRRVIAEGR
jgi:hypothetical protein